MTKKLKKREFLVETSEPFIVRHGRTEKHGEVTVAILNLAVPLRGLGVTILTPEALERVRQVGVRFPSINLSFNFKPEAPAFLFTVKSKTECRGTDTPNQEIGDMVAIAKAQAKAAKVAGRIVVAIIKELEAVHKNLCKAFDMMVEYESKEYNFVAEEKYMKVLEKRANKE